MKPTGPLPVAAAMVGAGGTKNASLAAARVIGRFLIGDNKLFSSGRLQCYIIKSVKLKPYK